MMGGGVNWNGEAERVVLAAAFDRIRAVVAYYHSALLLALNVSNPRPYQTPSAPGEAPRKRTGWLQGHVGFELDEPSLAGRVGVGANAKYGLFLELGTRLMRARPWLLATLNKVMDRLQAIARG